MIADQSTPTEKVVLPIDDWLTELTLSVRKSRQHLILKSIQNAFHILHVTAGNPPSLR